MIGVADMIKEPSDIFIWELNDGDRSLRQFYPAKYVGRQFFVKSPVVRVYFCTNLLIINIFLTTERGFNHSHVLMLLK